MSSVSLLNGKSSIPPAVPAVAGPPIAVSSNAVNVNGASHNDHGRKSSVTISAAGATGYMPNGGPPVAGSSTRQNSIVFGSIGAAGGSPAPSHSHLQPSQSASSLAVGGSNNPRLVSPQNSPSPIPQPAASGGRPPSGLHGQANSMSFGSMAGEFNDGSRPMRPSMSQGPQSSHLRRESSQSAHSDMSNPGMVAGPGRGGYHTQAGRGRAYNSQFSHQQMGFAPGYRTVPNGARAGHNVAPPYQGQAVQMRPYPESPHRANRSPAPQHVTPQMHPSHMASQQMQNAHYGAYANMGAQQGSYAIAPPFDPNYPPYPQTFPVYGNMYLTGPPSSPRPHYQHMPPTGHQAYVPAQYAQPQPQPMSRTSSAISEQRPTSSLSQAPTPSLTPATMHSQQERQGKVSPAQSSDFKIPPKKSAVTIKDPTSGAVKTFDKKTPSPPAVPSAPMIVSSDLNGPARIAEPQHSRSESKTVKSDEEKKNDMRDAIAKKIEADKAEERRLKEEEARLKEEEDRRALEQKQEEERRLAKEKEDAERREREAAEKAQREKEEAEQEKARQEAERAKKEAEEKAEQEAEARRQKEAEEARLRQEEQKAEEARLKAEAEAKAKAEAEAEAEAKEAAESEALKESATEDSHPNGDIDVKDPHKTETESADVASGLPASMAKITLESRASTPASEDSMGPPPKPLGTNKRENKPAALKLAPLETNSIEPPQPSAAMQSLKSARFIDRLNDVTYPGAIASPNPALNSTAPKGRFKYDRDFLLQFQQVFTEKPSANWESQLKESIGSGTGGGSGGGGGSESARRTTPMTPLPMPSRTTRPGVSQSMQMGSFVALGGRTLPPGTTSEERLALSNVNSQRQTVVNPLAQYRTSGFQFAPPPPMSRNASSSSIGQSSGVPPSPRPGNSRTARQGSKRSKESDKQAAKAEEQAAKTMPLTAGIEVKPLLPSSSGWKPKSLAAAASATGAAGPPPGAPGVGGHMEPDMVQRKVKAALNKMTPEKFDKISDQILEIAAQSKNEADGRTLRQVIQLTFEKATDEAHWASMYAKFCKRMLDSMSPDIKDESITDKNGNVVTGGTLFRKYLLNRCQEEFERGWKVNLPPKPEGTSEETIMLSDDYYIAAAAKRRGLGLVQFIGELYKLGMLTERIMHQCVKKLVDYEGVPDEAEVESLTKLLRTIGADLDHTERGKSLMDVYFGRIQNMIDTPDLPSRLRFMLLDVVDLRRANWASKEKDKGPQTIQEIRDKAMQEAAQKEAERARQQSRGGRMPMGRGDARTFSGGGQYGMIPPPDHNKNTVGMDDLRRLGNKAGSRQASQGPMTLGPSAMFTSRSSSGRKPLLASASVKPGEDSGVSSRTGTPPSAREKEPSTSANAFGLLAGLDASGEPTDSTSPPSATSSPPTTKSKPSAAAAEERPRLFPTRSDRKD